MDINQQYIADQLNLSRATVSRSLNNSPGIDSVTRGRVLELASRLGYRVTTRTRRKSTGSQIVGVLVCNPGGEFRHSLYADVGAGYLAGMSETASDHNAYLDVRYVDPEDAGRLLDPRFQPPGLHDGVWAGVLLIYPFPHEVVSDISHRMTCVSIVNHYDGLNVDCVAPDQDHAFLKLIKMLADKGHQKIGLLNTTSPVVGDWEYTRCASYFEALMRLGLPYDPNLILSIAGGKRMSADEQAQRVMALRQEGVTAWVSVTDRTAYEVLYRLKERNFLVPEDASFVGFDGIETPPGLKRLVTAAPPLREIGATALRQLLARCACPASPVRSIQLECTIVDGESISEVKV